MTEKKNWLKNITKWDIVAVSFTIIFLIIVSIPSYIPRDGCDVARPEYKCASFVDVMTENCIYWGEFNCDTDSDVSLEQAEWYIQNLCELQNKDYGTDLECSNLKKACNEIVGNQTC